MTPTVFELVGGAVIASLNALLTYVVAPPRVVVLAKLVRSSRPTEVRELSEDGMSVGHNNAAPKGTILVLTLQSYHPRDIHERMTVAAVAVAPGAFEKRDVECFAGIEEHLEMIRASPGFGAGGRVRRVDISVEELRAYKTFTFHLSCEPETTEVMVELHGRSRTLVELVPVLGSIEGLSAFRRPLGNFSARRRVCIDEASTPVSGKWGTKVAKSDLRVLAVAVALVCSVYLGASGYKLDTKTLAEALAAFDVAVDGPAMIVLAAITSLVFWLVRPTPGIVAQGYLEPQALALEQVAPTLTAAKERTEKIVPAP